MVGCTTCRLSRQRLLLILQSLPCTILFSLCPGNRHRNTSPLNLYTSHLECLSSDQWQSACQQAQPCLAAWMTLATVGSSSCRSTNMRLASFRACISALALHGSLPEESQAEL